VYVTALVFVSAAIIKWQSAPNPFAFMAPTES
jgi:hypothetical protein